MLLLLLIVLFFQLDLDRFLTIESLRANRARLISYYEGHKAVAAIAFIAVYVIQTALSLPGAAILSLAAGAIFGVVHGTLYANIAATSGAALAFLVSRYLLRDVVQKHFGGRLEALNRELDQRGFGYLLFLRLVPIFPFFLINLAAGMTGVRFSTFFFATLIGIIPGSFVFCNAGASLAGIESPEQVLTSRVLASLALLGTFALIPTIYGKWKGTRQ
ncbi:TVP38/TMEM64 family protein [Geotalea sp. SG265]|uniref:TVP38/TMEM64 family protein n=1 Tax=Geotalea sp. SG265 TaxID=2922867 RepID=UPI001FAF4917|nr:TVP38/TMEM64 family protein [Geotalea sp. SG265]